MFENELKKLQSLYAKGLFSKKYYKDRIEGKSSFFTYEEFCKIPFMYKQSIRDTAVFERTNTDMKDVYGIFSSSGTTGDKTFYVYNKKDKEVHEEFVRSFFEELDITSDDLGGVMAPVGTGVMAHTMLWQFNTVGAGYINCPEPSPQNMIDMINNVPITVIATRPNIASSIAYFPELIKIAKKSKVSKLALGGGFLSRERRKMIEEAWKADCYNCFGMSEMFGPMAAECKRKNGLHYLDKYLMIELIDPVTKKHVKDGKPGIAVYTTLWEKGFPLLRYWTDDFMVIDRTPCECGNLNPRLYYLGRLADSFICNQGYVFPEQVENILFESGLRGEYKVLLESGTYQVFSETNQKIEGNCALQKLKHLFQSENVNLIPVAIGVLNFSGFGRRFETKR